MLTLTFVLVLCSTYAPSLSHSCLQGVCSCIKILDLMDCSARSLTDVPKASGPLLYSSVSFSHNRIVNITIASLLQQFPKLKNVDFRGNPLNCLNIQSQRIPLGLRIFSRCSLTPTSRSSASLVRQTSQSIQQSTAKLIYIETPATKAVVPNSTAVPPSNVTSHATAISSTTNTVPRFNIYLDPTMVGPTLHLLIIIGILALLLTGFVIHFIWKLYHPSFPVQSTCELVTRTASRLTTNDYKRNQNMELEIHLHFKSQNELCPSTTV